MGKHSLALILLLIIAVSGPLAAYALYPPGPSIGSVSREVSEIGGESRPLGSMVDSVQHAVCYRGWGHVSGRPSTFPARHIVLVSGKPVIPAPGPWIIYSENISRPIRHEGVLLLMHRASLIDAWGIKASIHVPGRGRIEVLIATRIRLVMENKSFELRWMGSLQAPRS
jgi:hypothetical protein